LISTLPLVAKTLTGIQTTEVILPTVRSQVFEPHTTNHITEVWNHRDFQERVLWLWGELAKHYKDNKWIAGYNPLNEPTDSKHTRVVKFYNEVHKVIRVHDPDHIIFFDGNTFASDFSHFGDDHKNWDNTAYSIHDYSLFGFPNAPEIYTGTPEQKRRLKRSYEKKREWMDQRGLCVWNGEWGPVYARKQYDGEQTNAINEVRYGVLSDQLEIYTKVRRLFMTLTSLIVTLRID
jgi:hypothetical protein